MIKQISQSSSKFNELFITFVYELVQITEIDGSKLLFNDKTAKCLLDVMKINQIQYFRIFELLIKISTLSCDYLNECENYFKLNNVIESQLNDNNDDFLSKLNCLEMIKSLGELRYGFKYLEKFFKHLLSYVNNDDDILSEKFLVPGIIKLFGSLTYYYPKEIHENCAQFYICLFNNILLENSHDPDVQMKIELSLETLTLIIKNNEAKYIVYNSYKDLIVNRVFKQILKFIQYSINNLRLKSMDFLSSLVAINFKKNLILNNNMNFQEASELSLSLFISFISNIDRVNKQIAMERLFNILLNYGKQPFMELRLKSHDCFQSFTQSKWGLNYLLNLSNSGNNFIIYLIDRSTELEKEGRNSKYDLVKLVAGSEFILEYIDLNQLSILNRFIKDGPFYKESEMAVEFQNL